MRKILFLIIFVMSAGMFSQSNQIALIPKPQSLELKKGTFKIDENITLYFEPEFEIAGNFLNDFLQNGAGFQLKSASKKEANIVFEKDNSQPSEGYFLDISESKINIKAADSSGAFYAIQTLRQLLPSKLESPPNPRGGN